MSATEGSQAPESRTVYVRRQLRLTELHVDQEEDEPLVFVLSAVEANIERLAAARTPKIRCLFDEIQNLEVQLVYYQSRRDRSS